MLEMGALLVFGEGSGYGTTKGGGIGSHMLCWPFASWARARTYGLMFKDPALWICAWAGTEVPR